MNQFSSAASDSFVSLLYAVAPSSTGLGATFPRMGIASGDDGGGGCEVATPDGIINPPFPRRAAIAVPYAAAVVVRICSFAYPRGLCPPNSALYSVARDTSTGWALRSVV